MKSLSIAFVCLSFESIAAFAHEQPADSKDLEATCKVVTREIHGKKVDSVLGMLHQAVIKNSKNSKTALLSRGRVRECRDILELRTQGLAANTSRRVGN